MLRFLLTVLSSVVFSFLPAQSFFSMRGLGEEIINSDAVMTSLGSDISLSYQNPSFPIIKANAIFEAGIIGSGVLGKQGNNQRLIADGRPNFLKGIFALPFDFGIGLGLSERFNQNFNVYSDTLISPGYQRQVVGYGGIYNLGVSIAKSFYDHFGIGFEYERNFGDAFEQWFFEALPSSNITTDTVTANYSGDLLKFGLSANIWKITLGVLYEKDLPIYINSRVLSHGVITDSINDLKLELPDRLGFGLSFVPSEKFTIYLDYFNRNSQNTKINGSISSIYHRSTKYSVGLAYRLNERYILRLGYRNYDWYFTEVANKIIKEQAMTLGTGIPIPKFGSFNFALELINRKGGSLTENICRLNLTLHYEEAWKRRKRQWGY